MLNLGPKTGSLSSWKRAKNGRISGCETLPISRFFDVILMASAVSRFLFTVPFDFQSQARPGGVSAWDQITPSGLTRFIGDRTNELLKYLLSDQFPKASDWPVVLYGPIGTGKTSLALTVGNSLIQSHPISIENPDLKPEPLLFLTAADFCRRFSLACETDSINDLRRSFVQSECIIIDDIQKLSEKHFEQIEFVHLMELLIENQVPLFITCSDHPSKTELSSSLISRMTAGLCLSVQPPGPDARIEIISDLALNYGIPISRDGEEWLAKQLNVTVPRINHFFSQLKNNLSVEPSKDKQISIEQLKRLFSANKSIGSDKLVEKIIGSVAKQFHLKPADLSGSSRKQTMVLARSIAIYFCRKFINASYLNIGKKFGNRDHSTVMHAQKKIENLINNDPHSPVVEKIKQIDQYLAELLNNID